jgi:hypothetical protein
LSESTGLRAPWTGLLVAAGLTAYVAAGACRPGWRAAVAGALTLAAAWAVAAVISLMLGTESDESVEYGGGVLLFT